MLLRVYLSAKRDHFYAINAVGKQKQKLNFQLVRSADGWMHGNE